MTHVVTEACIGCRFTDCVEVCPVECFHVLPDRLVIDPEVCIDCGACLPACPVEAIYADTDVPAGQEESIEMNLVASRKYPVITESMTPLAEPEPDDPELQ
ncbi:MAG: ferredoxin family protein [Planctomycetota bacterium]